MRLSSFRHLTCLKNENGAGRDEKKQQQQQKTKQNKKTVSVNKLNVINQRVFKNGSNTLILFLEWIKLNCSCCTFSIAFDVVLFLV